MDNMYAMQRANGNWFAVNDAEGLRVPVFCSSDEAMQARARNAGMLLFKPIALDDCALNDLALLDEDVVGFWLVTNPFAHFNHGRPLDHDQLTLLARDLATQQAAAHTGAGSESPNMNLFPQHAVSAVET